MPLKILIIQLRQLGDILLTTPCLRYLRDLYPDARIDFLCHSMGIAILKHNPYVDEIITYNQCQSLLERAGLLWTLYQRDYDFAVDFMNNPRSALFTLATRARQRIGFTGYRSYSYSATINRPDNSEYIVQTKTRLIRLLLESEPDKIALEKIGSIAKNISLDFPFGPEDQNPAKLFFAGVDPSRSNIWIALSPTHRRPVRRWSEQRYCQLADWLAQRPATKVVWIWGPSEEEYIDLLISCTSQRTYKMPASNLSELAAFLNNCDYFIGTSNGPSHIAIAVGTPSLQLHGPTNAKSWCPLNEMHQAIQSKNFGNSKASLDPITLREVQENVEKQWPVILQVHRSRRGLSTTT